MNDHTRLLRTLLSAVTDLDELPHPRHASQVLLAAAVAGPGSSDDAVARAASMPVATVREVLPTMLDRCTFRPCSRRKRTGPRLERFTRASDSWGRGSTNAACYKRIMDDESSTATDLAFFITQAIDAYVKEHPGVHVMQVCAALGAAGGALASVSIPPGNEAIERTALDFVTQGFKAFLGELRRGQAN